MAVIIPQTWADAVYVLLHTVLAVALLAYILDSAWQVPGRHRRPRRWSR